MLDWFYKRFKPHLIIKTPEGNEYLERWRGARGKRLGVFLHRISAPDFDRDLHNHPWSWAFAIILSGGYTETIQDRHGCQYPHCVSWFNWIPGHKFHTIERLYKNPTWSLFVHGPRVQPWGFMRHKNLVGGWAFVPYDVKNFPNQVEGD